MNSEERIVAKMPEVPSLNEEAITLLTQLCFREDNPPASVDLVFFYSSIHDVETGANTLREVLRSVRTPAVMVSGGITQFEFTGTVTRPESDIILDQIDQSEFSDSTFYKETQSIHTLENITKSLEVLDFSNYRKILFIGKSHAAGRNYLTMRKYCPNTEIYQKTYSVIYTDDGATDLLTRDNWHQQDFGRSRVWGEFLRIIKYGREMKEIEYDEVAEIVERIEKLTT